MEIFTVQEVAKMLKWGEDSVRTFFRNKPGVIILRNTPKGTRRIYEQLRIPREVFEREISRVTR